MPDVSQASPLYVGEAELIAACQSGDEAAWNELFRRYRSLVFRHGLLVAGDAEGAADFVAEIFARLLAALPRFRGDAAFITYLRSMLAREGRRWRRREQASHLLEDPADECSANPATELVRAERLARVRRVIASLPPRLREVIVLRHVHDLSYQEIARAVRCPIGTVRSRLSKAREMLRVRLVAMGISERDEP